MCSDLTNNTCPNPWVDWHIESSVQTHLHGFIDHVEFAQGSPAAAALRKQQQCETVLLLARGLLLGIIVLWTVAEWSLASSIRRHATLLEVEREEGLVVAETEEAVRNTSEKSFGFGDEKKIPQEAIL